MTGFLAILALVSSSHLMPVSWANENCAQCSGKVPLPVTQCPPPDETGLIEARAEFEALFHPSSQPIEIQVVEGRSLKGSRAELDLAKRMLKGGKTPKAWKAPSPSCNTVLCALKSVMGNSEEAALRALVIGQRDGYPVLVSRSRDPDADRDEVWTGEELRRMDHAFQRLPSSFKKMSHLHNIKKSLVIESAGLATDYGDLQVSAARKGDIYSINIFETTFIHELGHFYDHSRGVPKGFEASDGSWSKPSSFGSWKKNAKGKFISTYAETSPGEDFAETVRAYSQNPRVTRDAVPEKYKLLKSSVFGGHEYDDDVAWKAIKLSNAEILAACYGKMTRINPTLDVYTTPDPPFLDYWIGMNVSSRVPRDCYSDLAARLVTQDSKLCARDGEEGLVDAFIYRLEPYHHAFEKAAKAWVAGFAATHKACQAGPAETQAACDRAPLADLFREKLKQSGIVDEDAVQALTQAAGTKISPKAH